MRGDAVGACLDREQRGANRIGALAAPRVTQGGDVIDIDAEAQRKSRHVKTRRKRSGSAVHALDPGDHGFGAQLRDNSAEMLEVIDLEIDGLLREIGDRKST